MKIGLSFSRCLRDIYDGTVDIDDVLVIIARTDFDVDNDDHWNSIWEGYTGNGITVRSEWQDYLNKEQEFRDLARELRDEGKLHQPRQFGAFPPRLNHFWLEAIIPEGDLADKPAVKRAWENYKLIAGLS